MPFASKNVVRTWLCIAIVSVTVVNVFGSEEKRLNLKIGFDLTQGANGAPSLRIRDFEESIEAKPRAKEEKSTESKESKHKGGKVRADSISDSDEAGKGHGPIKQEPSKESKESAKSNEEEDDDSNSSGGGEKLSTQGLKAGDYEPEENPKIHGKYEVSEEDEEEDSEKSSRRKRRSPAVFKR